MDASDPGPIQGSTGPHQKDGVLNSKVLGKGGTTRPGKVNRVYRVRVLNGTAVSGVGATITDGACIAIGIAACDLVSEAICVPNSHQCHHLLHLDHSLSLIEQLSRLDCHCLSRLRHLCLRLDQLHLEPIVFKLSSLVLATPPLQWAPRRAASALTPTPWNKEKSLVIRAQGSIERVQKTRRLLTTKVNGRRCKMLCRSDARRVEDAKLGHRWMA